MFLKKNIQNYQKVAKKFLKTEGSKNHGIKYE